LIGGQHLDLEPVGDEPARHLARVVLYAADGWIELRRDLQDAQRTP
jgi:hypothetical protein